MDLKTILDCATAVGTLGAVIIAMVAVYYTNKNSKRQIRISKLEELFEIIQGLTRSYDTFMSLHYKLMEQRKGENDELKTLGQYYAVRDKKIFPEQHEKLLPIYHESKY